MRNARVSKLDHHWFRQRLVAWSTTSHYLNQCGCILNSSPPNAAYMREWIDPTLVQIMACRLFGAKPLSKPNARLLSIGPLGIKFSTILLKMQNFSFTKMHLKLSSAKWRPFCPRGDELIGLGNKAEWKLDQNITIPIQENWFEIVLCKMAIIFSWPQRINEYKCRVMQ